MCVCVSMWIGVCVGVRMYAMNASVSVSVFVGLGWAVLACV